MNQKKEEEMSTLENRLSKTDIYIYKHLKLLFITHFSKKIILSGMVQKDSNWNTL